MADIKAWPIICKFALNGEKFQSRVVTLTLIGQCQTCPSYFHNYTTIIMFKLQVD